MEYYYYLEVIELEYVFLRSEVEIRISTPNPADQQIPPLKGELTREPVEKKNLCLSRIWRHSRSPSDII